MNRRNVLKAIMDSVSMFQGYPKKPYLNLSFTDKFGTRGNSYDHAATHHNLFTYGLKTPTPENRTDSRSHMYVRILRGDPHE